MDDNDLDLQPMDRGGLRTVIIGTALLAFGAGGAIVVQKRLAASTRAEQLARASGAWNELRFCLVGDSLRDGQRPTTLARLTELGVPRSVRILPAAERRREWPYRCATHASVMTHALFESGSDAPEHRMLAMLVSRAADALEEGQLRTGEHDRFAYLDELFEAARRAELPPSPPPRGPAPPPPAPTPLRPRAMSPVAIGDGAGELVATDPTPAATLRAVLGHTARRLCTFYPDADPARSLATFRCGPVPFADAPATVELLAAEDGAPAGLRVRAAGQTESSLFVASGASATLHRGGESGFVPASGGVSTLSHDPSGAWSLLRLGDPTANGGSADAANRSLPISLPVTDPARILGPTLAWDRVMLAGPTRAPVVAATNADAGTDAASDASTAADSASDGGAAPAARLYAAAMPGPDAHAITLEDLGAIASPDRDGAFQSCRAGDELSLVVRTDAAHVAVAFFTHGRWSTPVAADAPSALLSCRAGEATLTWTETRPDRRIQQLRCTPERCTPSHGPFPEFEPEGAVADLAGRVLIVAAPTPGRALTFRLAPLNEIAEARDVVAIDDADHGGASFERPRVFVRGSSAIVLATALGGEHATYAVRIDADGRFSAATPAPGAPRP